MGRCVLATGRAGADVLAVAWRIEGAHAMRPPAEDGAETWLLQKRSSHLSRRRDFLAEQESRLEALFLSNKHLKALYEVC